MRRAHIEVFLGLVIGVVAAGYGPDLDTGEQASHVGGGGYLTQNASLVLTMDPNLGAGGVLGRLEDADVLIEGDHIAAVGHLGQQLPGVRVIDGRGMIVMPGFVDTHDHLWQSLIRGCAADDDLNGWLNRCVFPLNTSPFSETDAYAGVRLSTTGLINTDVTTAVDWSHAFNPDFVRGNLRALTDS
jgi:5-methylthioadenosine/S-adenosylhomocysteine deaminase